MKSTDMKTFAETRGKSPFNWYEFLNQTTITDEEWEDAHKLSKSWVTCACGNLCDAIPRDVAGCPKDSDLFSLGCEFNDAIYVRDKDLALHRLDQIEKRSAEILKQL